MSEQLVTQEGNYGVVNFEEWRPIPDFPMYSVSDMGNIMRTERGKRTYIGRFLSPSKNTKRGYLQVGLRRDGTRQMMLVHRAVMSAFGDGLSRGMEVNHKNGNKMDNSFQNLEWVTSSQNAAHAFRNGLRSPMIGKRSIHTKLKDGEVWLIKKLLDHGIQQALIGKMFRVTKQCIWRIAHNQSWADIMYQGRRAQS